VLILDRTQRTWAVFSAIVVALATGLFCWVHNTSPDGARGGTLSGLVFGIISALMMIYAGLLGARRRLPASWSLGSGGFWMRSHLWIGTLTVPFALFHAGLSWGGTLEILLWLLFITVILSGYWGLAMQNILPKMMLDNLPRETFIQQIPYLCAQFVVLADKLVSSKCGPLGVDVTSEANSETADPKPAVVKSPVTLPSKSITAANVAIAPAASGDPPCSSDRVAAAVANARDVKADAAAVPAKAKADPQAILAAARARKEQALKDQSDKATQTTSEAAAPVMSSVAQVAAAAVPKPKPDAKAMLEAARKKKEQAVAELLKAAEAQAAPVASAPVSAINVDVPPPVLAKSKPDPRAMLEAARAKKEQAAAELLQAAEAQAAAVVSAPATANSADVPPPVPAKSKPDPRAMLEAARAKKEQAAAELLKAAEAQAAAVVSAPATANSADVPPPVPAKSKPDPRAMLEAARAKKEQAAVELLKAAEVPVNGVEPSTAIGIVVEVRAPSPAKPKPDAKAMLEAARLKKEQARGADSSNSVAIPTDALPQNPLLPTSTHAAAIQDAGTAVPVKRVTSPIAVSAGPRGAADGIRSVTASATSKSAVANQQQIGELKTVYLELVRPFLAPQPITRAWKESIRRAVLACRIRGAAQHPDLVSVLEELRDYCEQRQQFAQVEWYHFWMHRWLIFHIPATVAVYVVLLVHIVMALRVIPFGS
jgi:hypothetical protein